MTAKTLEPLVKFRQQSTHFLLFIISPWMFVDRSIHVHVHTSKTFYFSLMKIPIFVFNSCREYTWIYDVYEISECLYLSEKTLNTVHTTCQLSRTHKHTQVPCFLNIEQKCMFRTIKMSDHHYMHTFVNLTNKDREMHDKLGITCRG